jgi:hypothetical protein
MVPDSGSDYEEDEDAEDDKEEDARLDEDEDEDEDEEPPPPKRKAVSSTGGHGGIRPKILVATVKVRTKEGERREGGGGVGG